MIKANRRERFTAEDFNFMVRSLARTERDSVGLVELLTDTESRDTLLDHPKLLQSMLEDAAPLTISPRLYFYVLVRHVLKQAGVDDREVSDYVASMLECFSQHSRLRSPANGAEGVTQYVSDMMLALPTATPHQRFLIRAHMGNYALFITGIFHERVSCRSQRGGPDIKFFEGVGRTSYRAVAGHAVARSWDLTSVYEALADSFHEVRLALNNLADALLHFDQPKLSPLGLS